MSTTEATSPRPSSAIRIRVYDVHPDGERTELPKAAELTKPGPCGVPGCRCLAPHDDQI